MLLRITRISMYNQLLPLFRELHGICVILILQFLAYGGPLVTTERVTGLAPTSRYTVDKIYKTSLTEELSKNKFTIHIGKYLWFKIACSFEYLT